jgi:multidrug transporter EmrE-like cation transporter
MSVFLCAVEFSHKFDFILYIFTTILTVNSAWDGTSALIESLAAYILLGERFEDPFKYVGIAFIVVGLFFLRMPVMKEHKFVFPSLFHYTDRKI